jgi:hypothetical protein
MWGNITLTHGKRETSILAHVDNIGGRAVDRDGSAPGRRSWPWVLAVAAVMVRYALQHRAMTA